MSHNQLVTVLAVAPSLMLLTGFALRERRLRKAVRDGYRTTYGITGRKRDLDAQIADLRDRHDAVRSLGRLPNVLPFPARRGGAA